MPEYLSASVRPWLAILLGAATAVVAALMVGEYELVGVSSAVAGALVGLVVAEVIAALARARGARERVASASLAGLAMVWGGWIASGRGVAPMPASAWASAVVALVVGALGVRGKLRRQDASDAQEG